MGLLERPVAALGALTRGWDEAGALVRLGDPGPWPRGSSLVLRDDTAVELGEPTRGSRAVLLWKADDAAGDGLAGLARGVHRIGPDLGELAGASAPLGRVVLARGTFEDDFDAYLALQDAVSGASLEGVSVRSRPSSGQVWMRISAEAARGGLTLAHLGAALVAEVEAVDGVAAAAVLWICGDPDALRQLAPVADAAARAIGALVKRRTEDVMDCGSCEYNDICDEAEAP